MHLTLTTPAAALALDWSEVYGHLRLYSDDERTRIVADLVPAVTQKAEEKTGRQFISATWTQYLDGFPSTGVAIELPKPPLQSVSSIKYYDTAGVLQTWDAANYSVIAPSGPFARRGYIVPAYGIAYPSTQAIIDAVQIAFIAGYGAAYGNVPALIRAAMLLILGELYERREESTIGVSVSPNVQRANDLLWDFRVW